MKNKSKAALVIVSVAIIVSVALYAIWYYSPEDQRNFCTDESRNVDFCIEIYQPVCGWFGSNVQCIRYPCAITVENSCKACTNPDVSYWTPGECPEG